MERSGDHRSRSMPRSYPYAIVDSAQDKCIRVYGVSERKEQPDDLPKWGSMKFKYRNRQFWCRGYYVDTVGKNAKAIQEYVANQLKTDKEADQLSIFDPRDPLTGSK